MLFSWQKNAGKKLLREAPSLYLLEALQEKVLLRFGGFFSLPHCFKRLVLSSPFFFMILFLIRLTDPEKKWSYALFYSAASALGSYVIFKLLLKTQLPSGFLGF